MCAQVCVCLFFTKEDDGRRSILDIFQVWRSVALCVILHGAPRQEGFKPNFCTFSATLHLDDSVSSPTCNFFSMLVLYLRNKSRIVPLILLAIEQAVLARPTMCAQHGLRIARSITTLLYSSPFFRYYFRCASQFSQPRLCVFFAATSVI